MIPIGIELTFITVLLTLSHQLEDELLAETTGRKLVSTINDFHNSVNKSADAIGILIQFRDSAAINTYKQYLALGKSQVATLKGMLADNPQRLERVLKLEQLLDKTVKNTDAVVNGVQGNASVTEIAHSVVASKVASDNLLSCLNALAMTEQSALDRRVANLDAHREIVRNALMLGAFINVLMAIVASLLITGKMTRRLYQLIDNSVRIASNQQLPPPLQGTDEIAHLDKVLRSMAHELTQTMRKQRSILDNSTEVICSISEQKIFSDVNPAVSAVWGYSPDNVIGLKCVSIVHPDDVQAFHAAFDAAKTGMQNTFENRIIKNDGSAATMSWSVRWAPEESSLFCVVHDISERKELEKLKQEFVGIVSHELRSPLTSLHIKLQTLGSGAKGELPAAVAEDISRAEKNVKQMIRLTDDLLDLERLESGKWHMLFRKRSILSIVDDAVQTVQALLDSKNIGLVLPTEDVIAMIDGEKIMQVVINILSNAIKFAPEGTSITIAIAPIKERVEVNISDQGPGISEEDQLIIFNRFQQVNQHDSQAKGSGLGLSISTEIIKAHGGTIGVESRLGEGSSFWFRIPIKQESIHSSV